MSSKIEKKENNVVTLTLIIPTERFEEGMNHSYKKNRSKISLPGFRKGKAPRSIIEKQYGREVFMDDALDYVFPDAYAEAVKEHNLDTVSRAEIDVVDYNKEDGLSLTVFVTVKPEVKLGQYKGLTYSDREVEVTDAEIDAEINHDREKNTRIVTVTDRPIEDGDTAIIDFEGFVDGEPFDGGKSEDYELAIGSKTFVDNFEEQLIGRSTGDSLDVSVTFPEDYGNEKLSGKPAVFKVTVKEITKKELPELDDDFAQDVSEFDTFDEYKNSVKDRIKHQKEHKREHDIEDELIKQACENAEIDIPDIMIETQMNQMIMDFENRLRSQGLDLKTFMGFSGQTEEAFVEGFREPATNSVKARLVLEEIAKQEGINPTEEEIDGEIKRISSAYGIEEEKVREMLREQDRKGLEVDLRTQKALDLLVANGVATAAAEEEEASPAE